MGRMVSLASSASPRHHKKATYSVGGSNQGLSQSAPTWSPSLPGPWNHLPLFLKWYLSPLLGNDFPSNVLEAYVLEAQRQEGEGNHPWRHSKENDFLKKRRLALASSHRHEAVAGRPPVYFCLVPLPFEPPVLEENTERAGHCFDHLAQGANSVLCLALFCFNCLRFS